MSVKTLDIVDRNQIVKNAFTDEATKHLFNYSKFMHPETVNSDTVKSIIELQLDKQLEMQE